MKKLLTFVIILLVSTASMIAKNSFETKNGENVKASPPNQYSEPPFLVSFGTNLSAYLGEEGEWQLGYNVGLTVNFKLSKNLSMTLPFSFTRINTALKNVESRDFVDYGETIYKTLNDWQISVVFFEVPLLFTYKFYVNNSYDVGFALGPGLSVAINDFSKKKYTRTNEILGIEPYGFSLDPSTPDLRSGINIVTGIKFHRGWYYLDLLYAFYPYDIKIIYKLDNTSIYPYGIKTINMLNSVSLKLSIDLF